MSGRKGGRPKGATALTKLVRELRGDRTDYDAGAAAACLKRYVEAQGFEAAALEAIADARRVKDEAVRAYLEATGDTGNVEVRSLGVVKPAIDEDALCYLQSAAQSKRAFDV